MTGPFELLSATGSERRVCGRTSDRKISAADPGFDKTPSGRGTLGSLVRILRALGCLGALDAFLLDPGIRPV